jgi:hypothetical protein
MGRGNGGDGPVREVKGQEVNFHCSMLPCIHFEIRWMDPLPAPTFANWRAVDRNGQPVTLNGQHFQRIIRDVTTGPFAIQPPQRISTIEDQYNAVHRSMQLYRRAGLPVD